MMVMMMMMMMMMMSGWCVSVLTPPPCGWLNMQDCSPTCGGRQMTKDTRSDCHLRVARQILFVVNTVIFKAAN
jgi:cytochrome b561